MKDSANQSANNRILIVGIWLMESIPTQYAIRWGIMRAKVSLALYPTHKTLKFGDEKGGLAQGYKNKTAY